MNESECDKLIQSVQWTEPKHLISLAILGFIDILVIVGNCLVIAAVFCSHKLRSVTNFFIGNSWLKWFVNFCCYINTFMGCSKFSCSRSTRGISRTSVFLYLGGLWGKHYPLNKVCYIKISKIISLNIIRGYQRIFNWKTVVVAF